MFDFSRYLGDSLGIGCYVASCAEDNERALSEAQNVERIGADLIVSDETS